VGVDAIKVDSPRIKSPILCTCLPILFWTITRLDHIWWESYSCLSFAHSFNFLKITNTSIIMQTNIRIWRAVLYLSSPPFNSGIYIQMFGILERELAYVIFLHLFWLSIWWRIRKKLKRIVSLKQQTKNDVIEVVHLELPHCYFLSLYFCLVAQRINVLSAA